MIALTSLVWNNVSNGFSPLFVTQGMFWKGETRLSEEVGIEHCLMGLKALGVLEL